MVIKDHELYETIIHGDLKYVSRLATKEKVSLADYKELQVRTLLYLRCCLETNTYPFNKGLAKSLGYTYHALLYWRKHKKETPTGEWLEMFADMCAETLIQSGLTDNAPAKQVMFITKPHLDFIERTAEK